MTTVNNRAEAPAVVLAPFTPPSVCATLRLSIKQLTVGKKSVLRVTVRDQRGKAIKGVKISDKGAGIKATGKTNKKGIAKLVVAARSPGVLQVSVPGTARCAKRVGVIGVFQPPVTG